MKINQKDIDNNLKLARLAGYNPELPSASWTGEIPNYYEDLGAINDLLRLQFRSGKGFRPFDYLEFLREEFDEYRDGDEWDMLFATAKQKADALVKYLKL